MYFINVYMYKVFIAWYYSKLVFLGYFKRLLHANYKPCIIPVQTDSLKAGSGSGEVASTGESEKEWKGQKNRFHKQLAKYFLRQPFSQRVLEELPWQLLMSGDTDTLLQVLNDPL